MAIKVGKIVKVGKRDTIQEEFEEFDKANPWVYDALVDLAWEVKNTGRCRVGLDLLVNRLRWEYEITADGEGEFKLNDKYTSRYARLIVANEPQLAGLFELRRLRAA